MKKFLKWGAIVFIGLIVIGVIGNMGNSGDNSVSNSGQSQEESVQAEPIKISVRELADDFDSNQVAAENEWAGEYVEFTAEISNITDSGLSFSNIASEQFSMTQISCRVKDKNQLLSLKNGEQATVRGIIGKQTIGVIDVSDCEVQ